MRRRSFLRTMTGAFSAVVFTSAGWLMGTRSLTMGGQTPPPPPSGCVHCVSYWGLCEYNSACLAHQPKCNTVNMHYYSTYFDCRVLNCGPIKDTLGICNCLPCVEP